MSVTKTLNYTDHAYHQLERYLESFLALFPAMYQSSSNGLNQYKSIYCDTYAMVRVRQTSIRANSKPAQDEDHSHQADCQYLKPDVQPKRESWIGVVEFSNKYGRGNDEEEHDRCDDTMGDYEFVVFWEGGETTGHAWWEVRHKRPAWYREHHNPYCCIAWLQSSSLPNLGGEMCSK